MQRAVLPSPDAHSQLQALQAIQTPDAFVIHVPSFSSQQNADPQITKPRPSVSEITDPKPQSGLVPRRTASIPSRSAEVSEPTRPAAGDLKRLHEPPDQLFTA